MNQNLLNSLKLLTNECKELYLPNNVEIVDKVPKPLDFYRNWVGPNLPVLFKGACSQWPACKKWSFKYFRDNLKENSISISITPNGYADAVVASKKNDKIIEYFVTPEEKLMSMNQFLDCLEFPSDEFTGICYLQKQNSNLTEDFPELLSDIEEEIDWASECFRNKPDAVNLWIGDKRAITSMHKDPYENLYCVISGYKDFILHPPTDRPWIPYNTYPQAYYKETTKNNFDIIPIQTNIEENNLVPWICIDPLNPDYIKYPNYKNTTTLKVRVEAGDILYLPSLWFHHVQQSHGCIAVNYWYDMQYDIKYAYFKFLEKLVE